VDAPALADDAAARGAVVAAGRRLAAAGLAPGTSGNVSVRCADRVVVSPSGVALGAMQPAALSVVSVDGGTHLDGPPPTSELPLHLALYRSLGAGAVAHAHAVTSTALSCTHDELPAVHYNVMLLGGPPRTARYATFGSDLLAANVVRALADGRRAALMQNHGSVAFGRDLEEAVDRLELLEWLCAVYAAAHELGTPRVLTNAELGAAAERYRMGGPTSQPTMA
jgi:L-fuculose-phosphate aldolase